MINLHTITHSLYIHIPFCIKKCAYCDFFSLSDESRAKIPVSNSQFLATLHKEINEATLQHDIKRWETVFIGGGTPSTLTPEEIIQISSFIGDVTEEWTIEANPEDITMEWLQACTEAGITRISIGIQSFSDDILSRIGRRGSKRASLAALELLAEHWKGQFSADLITGLPGQQGCDIKQDVEIITEYPCSHVSLYSLTLEEGTPLYRSIEETGTPVLPDQTDADTLWLCGRDLLELNGIHQYEVSNFARSQCECKHNLIYWNSGNWIGVGPGASGTIHNNDTAIRYNNTRSLELWNKDPRASRVIEYLNRRECIIETLLMGLRLSRGVSLSDFYQRFSVNLLDLITKPIEKWISHGLLEIQQNRIFLNKKGLLVLNRFLEDCLEVL